MRLFTMHLRDTAEPHLVQPYEIHMEHGATDEQLWQEIHAAVKSYIRIGCAAAKPLTAQPQPNEKMYYSLDGNEGAEPTELAYIGIELREMKNFCFRDPSAAIIKISA